MRIVRHSNTPHHMGQKPRITFSYGNRQYDFDVSSAQNALLRHGNWMSMLKSAL